MSAATDALLCGANPICWVGAGTKYVARGAFKDAAEGMFAGFDGMLKDFLTSWVGKHLFMVDLSGGTVTWFQWALSWVNVLLLVVGLMVAGARVAYMARGEPFKQAMHDFGRFVWVATSGSGAIKVLLLGGDAFSTWILDSAGTDSTTGRIAAEFATGQFAAVALVLGMIGILAVACQWGIMIVRDVLLPLLAAFWPTAAAAAMLEDGQQAFKKVTAWILAFIIYSPLAAAIYAFAWRAKNGDDGVAGMVSSLVLVVIAILALPALMRLLVPASAALGRAVGGAMAVGITAAAASAGVAIGAAVATGGGSAAAGGAATAGTTGTTGSELATGTSTGTGPGTATTGGEIASGSGTPAADSVGGGSDATGATPSSGPDSAAGSSTDAGTNGPGVGGESGPTAGGASGSGTSGSDKAWAAVAAGTEALAESASGNNAEGTIGE